MKRVIVQILPADESSSEQELIQPANGNGTASGRNGQEADPGVRVEAVVSPERARIVVDTVLDAGGSNGDDSVDRMIERLVQRELASHDSGQIFHRVISSVERALLEHAFAECDHVQTRTADRLGVNRNTIHKKLLKHELIQGDDLIEPSPLAD
jgi:Fis family transcriptional regulator